jgi:hypothetical protein
MRIFLLFPVMLMRGVSGRSKPMRVGRLAGINMLRAPMEVNLF